MQSSDSQGAELRFPLPAWRANARIVVRISSAVRPHVHDVVACRGSYTRAGSAAPCRTVVSTSHSIGCRVGGTGRHNALKTRRTSVHAGSTPAPGKSPSPARRNRSRAQKLARMLADRHCPPRVRSVANSSASSHVPGGRNCPRRRPRRRGSVRQPPEPAARSRLPG